MLAVFTKSQYEVAKLRMLRDGSRLCRTGNGLALTRNLRRPYLMLYAIRHSNPMLTLRESSNSPRPSQSSNSVRVSPRELAQIPTPSRCS